jgi:hypothetical protein
MIATTPRLRPALRVVREPHIDLEPQIDQALDELDRVRANKLVTLAHHRLGVALADVVGRDGGANFHSWAVWGSREAGRTIAKRDLPGLVAVSTITGAVLGGLVGAAVSGTVGLVAGAWTVAVLAFVVVTARLERSSAEILAGNRTVLDDIGRATALFVSSFHDAEERDDDHFAVFAATLRPGPTEAGGQDLLRRAFACYYAARFETDPDRKQELVFAGNCFAVWHEHIRLQGHIAASMARPLRRWITRRLLDFHVGAEHLWVAEDPSGPYPATLADLDDPEADAADRALRRRGEGNGAADWARLDDRMNYVVELFRTRHTAPEVFAHPYG